MSNLLLLPLTLRLPTIRTDRPVWLILIPIAAILAMGLLTAWFIYCQYKGGWPAVDMPSLSNGGTWKAYCRK